MNFTEWTNATLDAQIAGRKAYNRVLDAQGPNSAAWAALEAERNLPPAPPDLPRWIVEAVRHGAAEEAKYVAGFDSGNKVREPEQAPVYLTREAIL